MGIAYERALSLYSQREYVRAHQEVTQELRAEPNSARAYALGALCNAGAKGYREARAWAETAMKLDRNEPAAHHAMGLLLYKDENCQCWGAAKGETASPVHLRTRRLDTAEEFAREAVRLDARSVAGLALLASILYEKGDGAAAMDCANRSLALDDRQPECYRVIARVFKDAGDTMAARAATAKAIACAPQNPASHLAHGWTLLYAGDHEEAIGHFIEAERLDPGSDGAKTGGAEAMRCNFTGYQVATWVRERDRLFAAIVMSSMVGIALLGGLWVWLDGREDNPNLPRILVPLISLLLAPIIWVFARRPLYNWPIQFNSLGRQFLASGERWAAWLTGVGVLVLYGVSTYCAVFNDWDPLIYLGGGLGLLGGLSFHGLAAAAIHGAGHSSVRQSPLSR